VSFLAQYDAIPPANAAERLKLVFGWIRTDTRAFFAELRERRPIFRTPRFVLVTRYNDVLQVLQRSEQFSVRIYGAKMDDSVGPYMLGRDGAVQNYRDKSVMRSAMSLSDLERIRTMVGTATNELLPETGGELDVVKVLSRPIPVRVCGDYFGFPGPNLESMLRWSKATQSDYFKNLNNDPAVHAAAVQAGTEMKAYIAGLVAERQQAIEGDPCFVPQTVVDRLVYAFSKQCLPFDSSELIANIAGLLIGAVETTSQAVVQALRQILIRPDVLKSAKGLAAASNHAEFSKVVREALRFDPINPLLFRFTESDSVLGDGTDHAEVVGRGTIVLACSASAMWDESVIDAADEFRVNRPGHSYLHFGHASHECLGSHAGEIMMNEIIRTILLRDVSPLGQIDFEGGPFPESYRLQLAPKDPT
jgi:cytochrome P450